MHKISGQEVAELVRMESSPNFSPRDWDSVDPKTLYERRERRGFSRRAIAGMVGAAAIVAGIPLLPYVVTLVAKIVYRSM